MARRMASGRVPDQKHTRCLALACPACSSLTFHHIEHIPGK